MKTVALYIWSIGFDNDVNKKKSWASPLKLLTLCSLCWKQCWFDFGGIIKHSVFTWLFLYIQLKIEGIRGRSFRGDIAIDDLSVADGSCSGPTQPPTAPPPTGMAHNCTILGHFPGWLLETGSMRILAFLRFLQSRQYRSFEGIFLFSSTALILLLLN